MRHRFRIKDDLYAAETFPAGDGFEVRVFCLRPRDGYFRQESAGAVLRLRGADEADLLKQAVRQTEQLIRERAESPGGQTEFRLKGSS